MLTSRKPAWLRRVLPLLAVLPLIALLLALPAPTRASSAGWLAQNGQRGAALVPSPAARFGSPASFDSLKRLHDLGANWVSIVAPFHTPEASNINFFKAPDDPTDDEIAQVVSYAHSLGMRVMIQPILVSSDGGWSGTYAPGNPLAWFAHYRSLLDGYARLAQQTQADEFCIGTEFVNLTQPQYSWNWREVISEVKGFYFGPLTYSANWGKRGGEYETIDWWDQLNYIGISAYFPLSWNDFNTEPLRRGWFSYTDPFGPNAVGQTYHWHDAVGAVQARWNKPVQFTRIGFASYANSPGRWDLTADNHLELSVQANAYDATMKAWADTPWLTGIFWTPWSSDPAAGGPLDTGDSPQNKPAEQILRQWYGQH